MAMGVMMTENVKRGVLIGCGFFSENHLNAWAQIDGASIVAVCDLDLEKARAIAKRFNIPHVYDDPALAVASEKPDFVDIATTVGSHRQLVELAVQHTKTVICQKPFAENMADAIAMVDAASEQNANLLIHENFRWQHGFRRIKSMIDEGMIGKPHFGRFSFRHGYDNYVNQPYLAQIERFTIMDVGLHLFDLARHFFGEVRTLSCDTQKLNPIVRGEDAFTSLFKHEGGATTICDCSFYSQIDPQPFPQTIVWIEGDKGTLALDAGYKLTLHQAGRHETESVEPEVPPWGEKPWHGVQDSVIGLQNHAVAVMTGNAQPQPSGADNLKTLTLALAAYESAETENTIHIAQWKEH